LIGAYPEVGGRRISLWRNVSAARLPLAGRFASVQNVLDLVILNLNEIRLVEVQNAW